MYQCGDSVVYANYGVCDVSEVDSPMEMGGETRLYYVLTPRKQRGGKVFVPMDKESLLRPAMSKDDALALIRRLNSIEPDPFVDKNSRTVEDYFKKQLRGCDCATAVRVAVTMRSRIQEQEQKKHLPSSMYTRILDQANQQVRSELCAALDITDEKLDKFVEANRG